MNIGSKTRLIVVALVSIILGGLVFLTVSRLSQERPVAPTAPESKPKAEEGVAVDACILDFTIPLPSASPTPPPGSCFTANKTIDALAGCFEVGVTLTVEGTGNCTTSSTQRTPLDVMLTLDTSCSMDDVSTNPAQPLTDAKTAAKAFIDQLDPTKDRVGLVTFGETGAVRSPLTSDFAALKAIIDARTVTCGTNIGDALRDSQSILTSNLRSNAEPLMVLLSDGLADFRENGGNGNSCPQDATNPNLCTQFAVDQGIAVKNSGTTLYTVALRNDGAIAANKRDAVWLNVQNTMHQIASSDSTYFETSVNQGLAGLTGAFDSIIDSVTTIVGLDAVITEILPAGVHYVAGSGIPAPTSIVVNADGTTTLTWNLGVMDTDQVSNVTFNVSFDSGAPNQLVEIFPDSGVSYEEQDGTPVTLPFPETYTNPLVCATPSPTPTATPTPTPTATPTPTPTPTVTPTPTPTVTPTPTPTPTATPVPTATPNALCVDIRIFELVNGEYQLVTDYSTLQQNDLIYFGVAPSSNSSSIEFTLARFKITANGVTGDWIYTSQRITTATGDYFITSYQLPAGVSSYSVGAEVYSPQFDNNSDPYDSNAGWR